MKIKGWPRARDDESFTSWLWRCGLNASCRKITEKNVADYCEYGDRTSPLNSMFFDPDFDFENVVAELFCEKFALPIKIVLIFSRQRAIWLSIMCIVATTARNA